MHGDASIAAESVIFLVEVGALVTSSFHVGRVIFCCFHQIQRYRGTFQFFGYFGSKRNRNGET